MKALRPLPIPSPQHPRRGAMLVLICMMLVVFLAMMVFAVDVSYMQLTRSELRAASDAAAKAGAEALRRTQSGSKAVDAALVYASYNSVGGKPFKLSASDVELGQTVLQGDGSWKFTAGKKPFQAVRVNSSMQDGSASGPVHLFFGGIFGREKFTPKMTAVASQFEQDLVLCLDRSHSMCFDLSGKDWVYPKGVPSSPNPITKPPTKSGSRWAALATAVTNFNTILTTINMKPRLGMVTWASDIGKDTTEYKLTGKTSSAVTREMALTNNYGSITTLVNSKFNDVMLGATNMSAGLSEAVSMLSADTSRPLARKSVILMTDGLWNQGSDPVTVAQTAKTKGIVIHTITFLPGADQTTMIKIAALTGGRHYYATNAAELDAAFRDLAYSMPVLLTE
jgi:Ca-activated chloride channel family protein